MTSGRPQRRITVANQLTLARIVLAGLFFVFALSPHLWSRSLALALFVTATLTDWLDGLLARKTGTTSAFGALVDPLADKLLVLAALIVFLKVPGLDIPAWVIFLTIARELIIGTLRGLAAVKGKVLAAERWGKWKMGVQTGCILAILGLMTAQAAVLGPKAVVHGPELQENVRLLVDLLPRPLSYVILVATWASGVVYLYKNRRLLQESWS